MTVESLSTTVDLLSTVRRSTVDLLYVDQIVDLDLLL